jgi:hypothetical protein
VVTRSTIVTVILLAAVYSQGAWQFNACAPIAPAAPISEIGAFSNMRHTEEHAYGETVLLWRSGDCLVGLFQSAQGLAGDTPIGELQDITHNPQSGELKFSAKLTTGLYGSASKAPRPSRDLFHFDGILSPARLIGGLIHANQLDPKPRARTIVLTASAKDADFMRGPTTYGTWRQKWEPILERRGPKW